MLSPRQLCQIFIPIGLLLIGALFYMLSLQPVLGFEFDPAQEQHLIVTKATIQLEKQGIKAGDHVVAIVTTNETISLSKRQFPLSLTARKRNFTDIDDYYLQQGRINAALSQSVRFRISDGTEVVAIPQKVNLLNLPNSVFSTVLFGIIAWLLTMLVWIWYPSKASTICLMCNGFGFFLMVFIRLC